MEVVLLLVMPVVIAVVCLLLSASFWQGFRNTKYWDKANKTKQRG